MIKRLDGLEAIVKTLTEEVGALRNAQQNGEAATMPLHDEETPQSLLCLVLLSNEITLADLVSFYFQFVHQRLALLSEEQLKGYRAVYPAQLNEQASILFLALSLVWLPVHHERRIFRAIKHHLFLTTHSKSPKLDQAQASLLLCYYMLTQGMIEEASMVITACEGSTRYLDSKPPHVTGERIHQKEQLALRRSIACLESLTAALSSDLSALSSQRGLGWDRAAKQFGLPDISSDTISDQVAVVLLRVVYEYVETQLPSQSSGFHAGLDIDFKLTRLIFEMKGADEPPLLDQIRGGGYVVALWALFRLHLSLLERARELKDPQFEEVSTLSLNQLLSITAQISRLVQRALDDATVHIRDLPPALCPILYFSVIADGRLRLGQSEYDTSGFRNLLVALRAKWALSGKLASC
ncbi:hypothetical protein CDV55_104686 [Aspergillus turcosus]|nr:hypothetical protein CDV55_104686 [Aspergillus turcosus]